MDDQRVWGIEESLWTADPQHYAESIDDLLTSIQRGDAGRASGQGNAIG